jgi:hypothetical protein
MAVRRLLAFNLRTYDPWALALEFIPLWHATYPNCILPSGLWTPASCRPLSSFLDSKPITNNQIKYFRIADQVLDQAAEEQENNRKMGRQRGGGRGEWRRVFRNSSY